MPFCLLADKSLKNPLLLLFHQSCSWKSEWEKSSPWFVLRWKQILHIEDAVEHLQAICTSLFTGGVFAFLWSFYIFLKCFGSGLSRSGFEVNASVASRAALSRPSASTCSPQPVFQFFMWVKGIWSPFTLLPVPNICVYFNILFFYNQVFHIKWCRNTLK